MGGGKRGTLVVGNDLNKRILFTFHIIWPLKKDNVVGQREHE